MLVPFWCICLINSSEFRYLEFLYGTLFQLLKYVVWWILSSRLFVCLYQTSSVTFQCCENLISLIGTCNKEEVRLTVNNTPSAKMTLLHGLL